MNVLTETVMQIHIHTHARTDIYSAEILSLAYAHHNIGGYTWLVLLYQQVIIYQSHVLCAVIKQISLVCQIT